MACHTMIGLNITMTRIGSGLDVSATHESDYSWTVNVTTNVTDMTTDAKYYPANVSYP